MKKPSKYPLNKHQKKSPLEIVQSQNYGSAEEAIAAAKKAIDEVLAQEAKDKLH